jgi:hypothetical protein
MVATPSTTIAVPMLTPPVVDLVSYDTLLTEVAA